MCYGPLMMRRAVVAAFVLFLGACDFGTLDDFSRDEPMVGSSESSVQALKLWKNFEKPDSDLTAAVADIGGIVERAGGRGVQVKIDPLKKEDLGIPSIALDPAAGQGMLIITELDCSLAQIEKLVVATNQAEIIPEQYEKYARSYSTSVQDFLGGAAPDLTWKTAYTVKALSRVYEADLTGGARRVAGAAPGGGAMLVTRTVLDAPARFISGEDADFKQDYQIEAFYETAPKKVTHFYGMWREFRVGSLTSTHDLYITVALGSLIDFDGRLSKVCRDNAPAPKFE